MLELLSLPFMQRALIAGVILGATLALLGVFVILKRMAFFSDGIAHASLAGVALGIIISVNPMITAMLFAVLIAILIYLLEVKYKVTSDAAIGLLFTVGMSLGIIMISLQPGYQPDLISFLFGNILAIDRTEMWIIAIVSVLILTFLIVKMRHLVMISLDMETAKLSGIKAGTTLLFLYIMLSLAVVLGIKILGVILVSALLIIPASTAKTYAGSFKKLLIGSVIISEITVISGIILSYYIDLPTGPTIVLVGALIFILVAAFCKLLKRN